MTRGRHGSRWQDADEAEAREAALAALEKAWALIPAERPDDLPGKTNSEGVYIPDHHHFETTVWAYGADIWALLTAHPSLRGDDDLFAQLLAVVNDRAAMRGRRSFSLLFGSVKLAKYAPQIAAYVDDPDVYGHVVGTLYKMRMPDYVDQIRPHANSPSAWIRKEAKRYLAKYDANPS
ncbi:hypothetical protein ACFU0W_14195 [Microbacterium keratanolyticum]|uniref:hypothetical protein n=1 Tax=Microbacterium keratanolyticum TaxID=67574 RepID=UPI003639CB5E